MQDSNNKENENTGPEKNEQKNPFPSFTLLP